MNIISKQSLRMVLNNSSQSFLRINFFLGTQIWKQIFVSIFYVNVLNIFIVLSISTTPNIFLLLLLLLVGYFGTKWYLD